MVNLTIRNIPEEILKKIRFIALKERRSLNSEMLFIIENGLSYTLRTEIKEESFSSNQEVPQLSLSTRETLWNEIIGKWQDSRHLSEIISDAYSQRKEDVNGHS
jgi:plasmid stability protein